MTDSGKPRVRKLVPSLGVSDLHRSIAFYRDFFGFALLDSWDRNNRIVVNLLRLIRDEHFDTRPVQGSPSIAELFMHLHYVRLVFVFEDAPEFGKALPVDEWEPERDRRRMI